MVYYGGMYYGGSIVWLEYVRVCMVYWWEYCKVGVLWCIMVGVLWWEVGVC